MSPRPARKSERFGSPYREPRQERGRERFQALLQAAADLLDQEPDRDLTIHDLASAAGVTTGALYHFFPNIQAVYAALVVGYNHELAELYGSVEPPSGAEHWEDVLRTLVNLTAEFLTRKPAALALIGGSRLSGEVLRADWEGDDEVAAALQRLFGRYFILPEELDNARILRLASHACASVWTASYLESQTVTDEFADHAFRVLSGYLRSWWGDLPARDSSPTDVA